MANRVEQLAITRNVWTENEDAILINGREATEEPLPYSEIHQQIPKHNGPTCCQRYEKLCNLYLTPEQDTRLWHLWMLLVIHVASKPLLTPNH